jgi:UDP-N-acetylmuramate dehydrogenase
VLKLLLAHCGKNLKIETAIRERVRLAPYTTLGIGGLARFFVEALTEDEVIAAEQWALERGLPLFVLGGGSNLLVADAGFAGLVLRVACRGVAAQAGGDKQLVRAGAGEDWDALVAWCVERELAGIECMSGIPGLVGGTPIQNVGAYGQEVSETIVSVRAYDRRTRSVVELGNADCGFAYRASRFNTSERNRFIVLAVAYALTPQGAPALKYAELKKRFERAPSLHEVRAAVLSIRAGKGMLLVPNDPDCRSAGSFFKNPLVTTEQLAELEQRARAAQLLGQDEHAPQFAASAGNVKVPAAWLIEKAGFQKGYAKGRAGLSSKHTLALVNRGGATAAEVLALMREIQERVRERFGVTLVPEPVFV